MSNEKTKPSDNDDLTLVPNSSGTGELTDGIYTILTESASYEKETVNVDGKKLTFHTAVIHGITLDGLFYREKFRIAKYQGKKAVKQEFRFQVFSEIFQAAHGLLSSNETMEISRATVESMEGKYFRAEITVQEFNGKRYQHVVGNSVEEAEGFDTPDEIY